MIKVKRRVFVTSIAVFTFIVTFSLYVKSSPVVVDLAPLKTINPSQHYANLVNTLTKTPIPAAGFSFVVLGDTRKNLPVAENVLKEALKEKPAFILHTGDLLSVGTAQEYLQYHMKLVEIAQPIPTIPVPANHEKGPNHDYAVFKAVYGGLRFSFDYGECRFVGVPDDEKTGIDPNDLVYLENELSHAGAKYKFVLTRVPPLYVTLLAAPEDGRGFTKHQDEFRHPIEEIKVTHAFRGHTHGIGKAIVDGIHYTITGGGGATLTKTLLMKKRCTISFRSMLARTA
jgi:hypothetical protein